MKRSDAFVAVMPTTIVVQITNHSKVQTLQTDSPIDPSGTRPFLRISLVKHPPANNKLRGFSQLFWIFFLSSFGFKLDKIFLQTGYEIGSHLVFLTMLFRRAIKIVSFVARLELDLFLTECPNNVVLSNKKPKFYIKSVNPQWFESH